MKVTRNVVNDLLPLYQAGEASEDSRALVEEFLRENPDFREEFSERAAQADLVPAELLPPPDPDLERAALERTRRHIRARNTLVGVAIALWTIPFLPFYDGHGFHWFMWVRNPLLALFFIAVATVISGIHTLAGWHHRRGRARR